MMASCCNGCCCPCDCDVQSNFNEENNVNEEETGNSVNGGNGNPTDEPETEDVIDVCIDDLVNDDPCKDRGDPSTEYPPGEPPIEGGVVIVPDDLKKHCRGNHAKLPWCYEKFCKGTDSDESWCDSGSEGNGDTTENLDEDITNQVEEEEDDEGVPGDIEDVDDEENVTGEPVPVSNCTGDDEFYDSVNDVCLKGSDCRGDNPPDACFSNALCGEHLEHRMDWCPDINPLEDESGPPIDTEGVLEPETKPVEPETSTEPIPGMEPGHIVVDCFDPDQRDDACFQKYCLEGTAGPSWCCSSDNPNALPSWCDGVDKPKDRALPDDCWDPKTRKDTCFNYCKSDFEVDSDGVPPHHRYQWCCTDTPGEAIQTTGHVNFTRKPNWCDPPDTTETEDPPDTTETEDPPDEGSDDGPVTMDTFCDTWGALPPVTKRILCKQPVPPECCYTTGYLPPKETDSDPVETNPDTEPDTPTEYPDTSTKPNTPEELEQQIVHAVNRHREQNVAGYPDPEVFNCKDSSGNTKPIPPVHSMPETFKKKMDPLGRSSALDNAVGQLVDFMDATGKPTHSDGSSFVEGGWQVDDNGNPIPVDKDNMPIQIDEHFNPVGNPPRRIDKDRNTHQDFIWRIRDWRYPDDKAMLKDEVVFAVENVMQFADPNDLPSGDDVLKKWLCSPQHYINLRSPYATEIGVSVGDGFCAIVLAVDPRTHGTVGENDVYTPQHDSHIYNHFKDFRDYHQQLAAFHATGGDPDTLDPPITFSSDPRTYQSRTSRPTKKRKLY